MIKSAYGLLLVKLSFMFGFRLYHPSRLLLYLQARFMWQSAHVNGNSSECIFYKFLVIELYLIGLND